jgi:hypothetical protein
VAKRTNDAAIEKATGQTWDAWLRVFAAMDASELSHAEIARRLQAQEGVSGWWVQQLTVLYEQHIGRRSPGQNSEGGFSVSVSKTVPLSLDDALAWWVERVRGLATFAGRSVTRGPEMSETPAWRYWRCALDDESRVTMSLCEKVPGKCALGLQHEGLNGPEEATEWRQSGRTCRRAKRTDERYVVQSSAARRIWAAMILATIAIGKTIAYPLFGSSSALCSSE